MGDPDGERAKGPGRLLIALALLQLAVSTWLVLWASVARGALPAWGGPVDVAIAFTLVGTVGAIYQIAGGRATEPVLQRSYHVATTLIPLIIVAVWIYRGRVDLNILLPGLAWRTFITLSGLPLALTLWASGPAKQDARR